MCGECRIAAHKVRGEVERGMAASVGVEDSTRVCEDNWSQGWLRFRWPVSEELILLEKESPRRKTDVWGTRSTYELILSIFSTQLSPSLLN